MKHIKKHPINDKAQKLSKDMKKQDLVKPKTDKKLDADDHLSDPKISKRYVKPSNKKLSSEKHLAGKKAKKVNESIDQLNDMEKRMIAQMEETSSSDYYYDNPSAAKDDVQYLLAIVKRLLNNC